MTVVIAEAKETSRESLPGNQLLRGKKLDSRLFSRRRNKETSYPDIKPRTALYTSGNHKETATKSWTTGRECGSVAERIPHRREARGLVPNTRKTKQKRTRGKQRQLRTTAAAFCVPGWGCARDRGQGTQALRDSPLNDH